MKFSKGILALIIVVHQNVSGQKDCDLLSHLYYQQKIESNIRDLYFSKNDSTFKNKMWNYDKYPDSIIFLIKKIAINGNQKDLFYNSCDCYNKHLITYDSFRSINVLRSNADSFYLRILDKLDSFHHYEYENFNDDEGFKTDDEFLTRDEYAYYLSRWGINISTLLFPVSYYKDCNNRYVLFRFFISSSARSRKEVIELIYIYENSRGVYFPSWKLYWSGQFY